MDGLRVGVTAARRGQGLVTALERRGASVLWGPTLSGDHVVGERCAEQLAALWLKPPAWFVASTGVGVRSLVEIVDAAGDRERLVQTLHASRVVARGAKAHAALRALDVEPVFVSPQETDHDTASWVARRVLPGDTVAVIAHGGGDLSSYRGVADAGATMIELRPYDSAPTADSAAALRVVEAAIDGELDAVICTSPGSFRGLVAIAAQHGKSSALLAALREQVAVAAIGPVTAAAVESAGGRVTVMPLRQRTADLINALEAWASRGARVTPGPITLRPDRNEVALPDRVVALGEREFNLVAALVRRPNVVCRPDVLAVEVWGSDAPADATAVKHQVSRVRRKLGEFADAIETIRSVGYRYNPIAA